MKRHDIINTLIKRYKYKSYLEIGVDEGGHKNDQKVQCQLKHTVDPAPGTRAIFKMTSDEFFKQNKRKYGLIFIDGLHHCDQVKRDIGNALMALEKGGTIVLHDCNPITEAMQKVPRIQGEWTGDVWKAFLYARQIAGLVMYTVDTDYGCGIIQAPNDFSGTPNIFIKKPTYKDFEKNKKEWLNLISVDEFLKKMSNREIPDLKMSVCIPTFEQYGHGYTHLTQLFQSLVGQKGKFEVVISDNSKDSRIQNLCQIYSNRLNIKYIHNPIIGISANTNNAIDHATYDKIKIMYMDDVLIQEDALLKISNALNSKKWVLSSYFAFRSKGDGPQRQTRHTPAFNPDLLKIWRNGTSTNTIGMPSVTGFIKNGIRFDPNLKVALDIDFYYQMRKAYGDPEIIREYLIGCRYHDNSTSRKQNNLLFVEQEAEYLRIKHNDHHKRIA